MSASFHHVNDYLHELLLHCGLEDLARRLRPKREAPVLPLPAGMRITFEGIERRWSQLHVSTESRAALADPQTLTESERYAANIENFIGAVRVPVGLAGPLRVNGLFAQGDYYLPMATTEAAVVASYSRGAQLISEVGGCTAMLLNESVSRAPGFAFRNLEEVGRFFAWALTQREEFHQCAEATTHHGKLIDMKATIEGNHIYLNFEYVTGDAAGQNMVTIATEAICRYILERSPVAPQYHFLESNLSGDKKASAQSYLSVRGKKVTAEVLLPADLIARRLNTTPERMTDYWRMSALGGVQSGTIGVQGQYANGLAALYIACGQDAACVAESAVGITRFEVTDTGALYAAVTLPNLMVGTVGGGTGLPGQRACLEILGLSGDGCARAFAEVCAAMALAGDLSITGALCAGDFARAHQRLSRYRRPAGALQESGRQPTTARIV